LGLKKLSSNPHLLLLNDRYPPQRLTNIRHFSVFNFKYPSNQSVFHLALFLLVIVHDDCGDHSSTPIGKSGFNLSREDADSRDAHKFPSKQKRRPVMKNDFLRKPVLLALAVFVSVFMFFSVTAPGNALDSPGKEKTKIAATKDTATKADAKISDCSCKKGGECKCDGKCECKPAADCKCGKGCDCEGTKAGTDCKCGKNKSAVNCKCGGGCDCEGTKAGTDCKCKKGGDSEKASCSCGKNCPHGKNCGCGSNCKCGK
jgi:hypothetical protein